MMRPKQATVVALAIAVGLMWLAAPASAHGDEEDGADPVVLVEQALAIIVNSPGAVGEALERVEAALEAEAEAPTGNLNIASLEEAVVALEAGDLHQAEDALISALGTDPHQGADEPDIGATEPSGGAAEQQEPPDETAVDPTPEPTIGAEAEQTSDPSDDVESSITEAPAHGLTERVAGGFRAPSSGDAAALAVALVLAIGGLVLTTRKRGTHS